MDWPIFFAWLLVLCALSKRIPEKQQPIFQYKENWTYCVRHRSWRQLAHKEAESQFILPVRTMR